MRLKNKWALKDIKKLNLMKNLKIYFKILKLFIEKEMSMRLCQLKIRHHYKKAGDS